MATTSPINQLPISEDGDSPDILGLKELADMVDTLVFPALSDTRQSSLQMDSGALSYNTTYKRTDMYAANGWQHTSAQWYFQPTTKHCEDTTFVDTGLAFPAIQGHSYTFMGNIIWETHTSNDIKFAWSAPACERRRWSVPTSALVADAEVVTDTQTLLITTTGIRAYLFYGYIVNVTTSGMFKLQFAKNTNTDTGTPATTYAYGTNVSVIHIGGG